MLMKKYFRSREMGSVGCFMLILMAAYWRFQEVAVISILGCQHSFFVWIIQLNVENCCRIHVLNQQFFIVHFISECDNVRAMSWWSKYGRKRSGHFMFRCEEIQRNTNETWLFYQETNFIFLENGIKSFIGGINCTPLRLNRKATPFDVWWSTKGSFTSVLVLESNSNGEA